MENDKNIKRNPFKVPDNYFEDLPSMIQDRIARRVSRPKTGKMRWLAHPGWKVAAAFTIIAGLTLVLIFSLNDAKNGNHDISVQEDYGVVSEYLLKNMDNTELFSVYMDMTQEVTDNTVFPVDSLSEQEVVDYLVEDDLLEYYLINDI